MNNGINNALGAELFAPSQVARIKQVRGIVFPERLGMNRLIVTGPPGCGKTTLMNQVGGWPEEGFIDTAMQNWWRSPNLMYRPREVHLGLPFKGVGKSLAVYDREWMENFRELEVDFQRIAIPFYRRSFLATNWRTRYIFEFMVPAAEEIYQNRLERAKQGTHEVDREFTLEQVEKQVAIFKAVALHFHRSGMLAYVRDGYEAAPKCFHDIPVYESDKAQHIMQYMGAFCAS